MSSVGTVTEKLFPLKDSLADRLKDCCNQEYVQLAEDLEYCLRRCFDDLNTYKRALHIAAFDYVTSMRASGGVYEAKDTKEPPAKYRELMDHWLEAAEHHDGH